MGLYRRCSRALPVLLAGLAFSCGTVPTSTLTGPGATGFALGVSEPSPGWVAPQAPQNLVVLAPEVVLSPGEVFSLARVVLFGDGRKPAELTWSSSQPQVASVDLRSGLVTARAPGFTEITAYLDAGRRARVLVEVSTRHTVASVTIEPPALAMDPGERRKLSGRVEMARGEITGAVVWSSSDYTVASVNPTTGEVTALAPGEITIKATAISDTRRFAVARLLVRRLGEAVRSPSRWEAAEGETTATMSHVTYVGYETCFAVGGPGVLLKSVDGGRAWREVTPGPLKSRMLGRLAFASRDRGFVTAGNELWETADGGETWHLKLRSAAPFLDLAIGPDGEGVLTDGTTRWYRTADAGESWQAEAPAGPAAVEGERRAGGQRWLVGGNQLYGWRGGWTPLPLPVGRFGRLQARQLSFVSAHEGWFVNGEGRLYRTDDGGEHWYEQRLFTVPELGSPRPGALMAVRFFDRLRGAMVRGDQYMETRDGGQSWTASAIAPPRGQVTDVWWSDDRHVWLVGTMGLLLRLIPG